MFSFKPTFFLLALATPFITAWPNQSFKTVGFTPPTFKVTESGAPLADGLLFLTPVDNNNSAAVIMKNSGELVWSAPTENYTNLRVQKVDGQPALTYWNGSGTPNPASQGHGYGAVYILDTSYNVKHIVCPNFNLRTVNDTVYECQADVHESYMTERNTLLVSAYNVTQADLTAIGGASDGWILDSLFFEVDIHTSEVLFSWSALDHVNISDSFLPLSSPLLGVSGTPEQPYDFFHINSIQSVGSGYLVNSRMLWTTYMLDRHGVIQWRFEGSTGGDFTLPRPNLFSWEHHVRIHSATRKSVSLSMFNNNNTIPPSTTNETSGLFFTLNLKTRKATLDAQLTDPKQPLYVPSQGAVTSLSNGNIFMGYGAVAIMKEYTPAGDVALSIQFGDLTGNTTQSYRAYRFPWHSAPAVDPVAIVDSGSVYMSWNGATDVTSWKIYEGLSAEGLVLTKTVKNAGFETSAKLKKNTKYARAAAYTGRKMQRHSNVVKVGGCPGGKAHSRDV